jgi:hypothetical protein
MTLRFHVGGLAAVALRLAGSTADTAPSTNNVWAFKSAMAAQEMIEKIHLCHHLDDTPKPRRMHGPVHA